MPTLVFIFLFPGFTKHSLPTINPLQELLSFDECPQIKPNMSDCDLLFQLPIDLCCAILRNWLMLVDVVCLDSAVCNAEQRPFLLSAVFQSPQCILSHITYTECYRSRHHRELLNWLTLRQIRVSGLFFGWDVDDSAKEYLKTYGESIKTIELWGQYFSKYMRLVSQYCPGIVCLVLEHNRCQHFIDSVKLFNCNLKALCLSCTDISDFVLKKMVKKCPNITHLDLSVCLNLTDRCGQIIGAHLKHLQCLDISNTTLSDDMLLSIAEHNNRTLQDIRLAYCEQMIGHGIKAIFEKCVMLRSAYLTYRADWFVGFDFALLSNLSTLCLINQDRCEKYLTLVAKHCKKLQRLFLDFQDSPESLPDAELFDLDELTGEGCLPELKVLAPLGVEDEEVEWFSLGRPEVLIDKTLDMADRRFYDMSFYLMMSCCTLCFFLYTYVISLAWVGVFTILTTTSCCFHRW